MRLWVNIHESAMFACCRIYKYHVFYLDISYRTMCCGADEIDNINDIHIMYGIYVYVCHIHLERLHFSLAKINNDTRR